MGKDSCRRTRIDPAPSAGFLVALFMLRLLQP